MVNIIKNKHKLCMKYESDIWGLVLAKGKFNKVGEFLQQLTEGTGKRRDWVWRSNSFKQIIRDRKKVCLYYGGLKLREYKRYSVEAKENGRGDYCDDMVSLLECRLSVVVYRLKFANSVQEGMDLVKGGYFLVNKEVIRKPGYAVQVGDIIEVSPDCRYLVWNQLKERVTDLYLPMGYPKYLEVNYKLMSGILLHKPKIKEVYYPFELEPYFYYISYNSRI